MTTWMKVSNDRLELPLAVASSCEELARICGVSSNNIASAISHAKKRGHKSQYIRVEDIDDEMVDSISGGSGHSSDRL